MNTKKIAKDFGLKVTHVTLKNIENVSTKFEIKKTDLTENAFMINDEDIVLGIYDNREFKQAAFFHEIGHMLVTEQYEKLVNNDEMLIEFQAWIEGLKVAKKYRHHFSNKCFKYILKSINSYYRHALSAYNTKK